MEEYNFGWALSLLKQGKKVYRSGWNGKGMWLWLCIPDEIKWTHPETLETYDRLPYIYMKTANNKVVPWLASQTDILADDWNVIEN